MSPKQSIGLIILAVGVLIASMSAFVVGPREQALGLQFGKPVEVIKQAGLHFKRTWASGRG